MPSSQLPVSAWLPTNPLLLLMCVLQIGLVLLHAPDWASLTDSSRDGDIMET